jgi:hypothetical protein
VDLITRSELCMKVDTQAVDLSRSYVLRFISVPEEGLVWPVGILLQGQLTKLDLASYKECVAVKEFALNRCPIRLSTFWMGR